MVINSLSVLLFFLSSPHDIGATYRRVTRPMTNSCPRTFFMQMKLTFFTDGKPKIQFSNILVGNKSIASVTARIFFSTISTREKRKRERESVFAIKPVLLTSDRIQMASKRRDSGKSEARSETLFLRSLVLSSSGNGFSLPLRRPLRCEWSFGNESQTI